jgi:aryl-alcohol dehydrogenase-like predicted oxidoreductase
MARVRSPEKRTAILQAAVHEIAKAGLGAPTAKIARRAGVPAGTLFLCFANKEELLNELYLELKGEAYKRRKDFLPEEQRAVSIISAAKSVSEQTGRSMAQVALAWLGHQTVPVIPIIGARKVSQLQDNLASLHRELSAEQLKSLDGAGRIEPGFPQGIYDRETVRAV